jgi:hypothetical protein
MECLEVHYENVGKDKVGSILKAVVNHLTPAPEVDVNVSTDCELEKVRNAISAPNRDGRYLFHFDWFLAVHTAP